MNKQPMIMVDTREQKSGHVESYFEAQGIKFARTKLFVGDYMLLDNPRFVIDRKRNLSEWSGCLFASRRRFYDEVRRARDAGITLAILIEHSAQIKTIEDIAKWHNPLLKKVPNAVTGRDLREATYHLHIAYGVPVYFCDKRHTGQEIVRILTEALKKGNDASCL